MPRVAIVDYGMGNVDSVARALEQCGADAWVTDRPEDFAAATHILLPGVGAFGQGMQHLRERGLIGVLREQVEQGIPFLGICLGMQLLATRGYEHGEHEGLGWIPGDVVRLAPLDPACRIPHVGWNEVHAQAASPLFEGLPDGKDFYFVHSYHFQVSDPGHVLATTMYGDRFVAAVRRDNVMGVQFHPEKSQKVGFQVLRNFLAL